MKLSTPCKVAIRAIDRKADEAGLPAYSEVVTMLAELATVTAEREVQKTVKNCNEMVDAQMRTGAMLGTILKFGVRS